MTWYWRAVLESGTRQRSTRCGLEEAVPDDEILEDVVHEEAVLDGDLLEDVELKGAVRDAVLDGEELEDAVLEEAVLEEAVLVGEGLEDAVDGEYGSASRTRESGSYDTEEELFTIPSPR